MEPDLVAVGEVMLDVVLPDLRVGRVTHAPISVRAGGVPVNAAAAVARLGARAAVIGRVGRDAAAAAIRHDLDRENVQAVLSDDAREPTGTFVTSGRTIVADRGASRFLGEADIPSPLRARAVLVSGHVLLHEETVAAGRATIDRSQAKFIGVVVGSAGLAASHGWARFRELTDGVGVVFANAEEGRALASLPPPGAATFLAASYPIAFVTDAEGGAYVAWDGQLVHRAPGGIAPPAVGAGDAFAGAALHALTLGTAPDAALDRAARAAEEWAHTSTWRR